MPNIVLDRKAPSTHDPNGYAQPHLLSVNYPINGQGLH
jgi:hypothetical protein